MDPDFVAVSLEVERLIIDCERLVIHRVPAERDANWSHLVEFAQVVSAVDTIG